MMRVAAILACTFTCTAAIHPAHQARVIQPLYDDLIQTAPWFNVNTELDLYPKSCDFAPESNSDCINSNCTYCPFDRCFARPGAQFYDEAGCNVQQPILNLCKDLLFPNPLPGCPHGLSISWTEQLASQLQQGVEFQLESEIDLGDLDDRLVLAPCGENMNSTSDPQHGEWGLFTMTGVLACTKASSSWWCRDIVPSYQPDAVLKSPVVCTNDTASTFKLSIDLANPVTPNEWFIYARYTFFTQEPGQTNYTKWHATKGSTFLVQGRLLGIHTGIYITLLVLASVLLVFPGLTFLTGITVFRTHPVIKASSFEMCVLIILGAILGFVSMYAFIPENLTDTMCQCRQWLLPLGFDFLFVPLFLKTYRVYRVFNPQLERVEITNKFLFTVFAAVIGVEVLFNALWTGIPDARLRVGQVFSDLDPNAFELECLSNDPTMQTGFTATTLVAHSIPLVLLTILSQRIRLSFKNTEILKKYDRFDESLYIMLALLDILFISLFVITTQFVIDDNPNVVTVLRCSGIGWVAAFTLLVLFYPKFADIYKTRSKKDDDMVKETHASTVNRDHSQDYVHKSVPTSTLGLA